MVNGKEFTQRDMDIGEQLAEIAITLKHVLGSQGDVITRLDSSLEKNDDEHDMINDRINNNHSKINRIIGVGVGVISVAGLFVYLMRVL